ncbi:MAG: hypothetical protein LAT61_15045 [Alcanivorax sp.]|nr:hypothetical protein [Alcanivorax sp.]
MKKRNGLAAMLIVTALVGCSATEMTRTSINESGNRESVTYTKYYSAGEWAVPGEIGLEIWMDHEKKVGPFYSIQRALGALGPNDLRAEGLVTIYFVNLDDSPRRVTDINVSLVRGAAEPLEVESLELAPRSVTKAVPGRFPISNYGTEAAVSVQFRIDDLPLSTSTTLRRLTHAELQDPRKDFPYFQAPYYPFDPPLAMPQD